MARTRKLSPERKVCINSLIEHYHPEDAYIGFPANRTLKTSKSKQVKLTFVR